MGGGRIFLKNLRDTTFNKDLLNEPNFDLFILLDSTFKYLFEGGGGRNTSPSPPPYFPAIYLIYT